MKKKHLVHKKTKNTRKKSKSKTRKSRKSRNNRKTKKSLNVLKVTNQPDKLSCSPKPRNQINEYSCYTNKSLLKLKNMWNARHEDVIITSDEPKEIHRQLTNYLADVCEKESCWLKQHSEFGKDTKELVDSFAPVSSEKWKKNPREWLDSTDIIKVMKQYEKANPDFEFVGPSPIDFDTRMLYGECVWDELCNFSLSEQIKRGKTKIGFIFNTDPHNKPGEHWISMFLDINEKFIFYFDSTGDKIPKRIKVLVKRIQEQGMLLGLDIKYDDTHKIPHQKKNTECGMYSLFFIAYMLENKINAEFLKDNIIGDDYVAKYRNIFFNKSLD